MASTGFKPARAGSSVDSGTAVWSNPDNVELDDGNFADTVAGDSEIADTLRCVDFDFSSIPGGSTILGIEVRYRRFNDSTSIPISSTSLQLVLAGVSEGSAKTVNGDWEASETANTQGGAADLWGDTPSLTDVQTNTYGVDIIPTWLTGGAGSGGAKIDIVEMNVHYSATATYTQSKFRGRNDDGSEAGATYIANADTNFTIARGQAFRVRFLVQCATASELGFSYEYEQNLNGGGFTDLAGGTALGLMFSAHFTQDDDTTDQGLGAGTFTTDNNAMRKNIGLPDIFATIDAVVNEEWDAEVCVRLDPAQVAEGNTVQLRIKGMDTYTITPTITAAAEVAPSGASGGHHLLLEI